MGSFRTRPLVSAAAVAIAALGALLLLGAGRAAPAKEGPDEVARLREEVAKLSERVATLEARIAAIEPQPRLLLTPPAENPPVPERTPQRPREIPEGSVERKHNGVPYYVVPLDQAPTRPQP